MLEDFIIYISSIRHSKQCADYMKSNMFVSAFSASFNGAFRICSRQFYFALFFIIFGVQCLAKAELRLQLSTHLSGYCMLFNLKLLTALSVKCTLFAYYAL